MVTTFEGSYLGDRARLAAAARLECKICWWVYDPALGDAVWQIAPGTPFAALPAHWRCPRCDGDGAQFMVVDGMVDEGNE
ncbi:MAG: rubredoxin [Proteobacteria bacterium]|nr:rubredoxin [Pseudomonadota bacterium]